MLFALTSGGTLILTYSHDNLMAIPEIIHKEKISVTIAILLEYSAWFRSSHDTLQACSTWKLAFCGGENISTSVVKGFEALGLNDLGLVSIYGSTACPIMAAVGVVDYKEYAAEVDGKLTPAGRPSLGYQIWVANTLGHIVPPTCKGEVWIQGEGVVCGYFGLGADDEDFRVDSNTGSRSARTGDFGFIKYNGVLSIISQQDTNSVV